MTHKWSHTGSSRNARILALVWGLVASTACSDLGGNQQLPAGVVDPGIAKTTAGAAQLYVAARTQFQSGFASFVVVSGLLTDELQSNARALPQTTGIPDAPAANLVDSRNLPGSNVSGALLVDLYKELHGIRAAASQANGALAAYDASHAANRRGALYAFAGYAELMLADLYCSGVPLSTLDFDGDFTYKASSPTDSVYRHAIALFDTARTLGADSAPVVRLASVGQGRAWLALGQYDSAAAAVQDVPTEFRYDEQLYTCALGESCLSSVLTGGVTQAKFPLVTFGSESDGEGERLAYRSSGDPRTVSTFVGTSPLGGTDIFVPSKYTVGDVSSVSVASGIEARLIEAEATLQSGGTSWFPIINGLRTDGTFTTTVRVDPVTADSIGVDTTWGLGTGQVNGQLAGVRPLADPGTVSARVDSLFADRAFWLLATGHRQGDLRRLVRRYGRNKDTVYPVGSYPVLGAYGQSIDLPIPENELANPHFHGCLSRD